MTAEHLMQDLSLMIPELFMTLMAFVLVIFGVFRGNGSTLLLTWLVSGVALVAAGLLILSPDGRFLAFSDMLVFDSFSQTVKFVILLGMAATLIISLTYIKQETMRSFEYPILVLLSGIGMMIMISSHNLLALYMGLELQSLALYVLAAIQRQNVKSSEAGLKYFILGAIASGMLLFGCSLLYGFVGHLDYAVLGETFSSLETVPPGAIVGMVMVLIAIAFKISAAPFHMWTPDVYEGSPTSVTAFFAIVPKIAAFAMLIRLLFEPFERIAEDWQQVIWALSAASMIVGAFAALVQNNVKRLLAYSSIGHMGYALIGLVAVSPDGTGATLFYLMIYMVMSIAVFGLILVMQKGEHALLQLDSFAGLSKRHPVFAYSLAILMFSMAGIPPFAGFFGKLFIFQAAVESGQYILAVLGVLTSVVAAFYYLKLIKIMFFDEPTEEYNFTMTLPKKTVVGLCMIFVIGFVFMPSPLLEMSRMVVGSLF